MQFVLSCKAARETGALQATNSKLAEEVEELTLELQQEKRMRVGFYLPNVMALNMELSRRLK